MPATYQKTWTDLLGPYRNDAFVSGCDIVCPSGEGNRFIRLWTFDSTAEARACYNAWLIGH